MALAFFKAIFFVQLLYGVLAAGNSYHSISKRFCGKISCLSKYLLKFSRTPGEPAKAIATFKEPTNNKIPQTASVQSNYLASVSHYFIYFLNIGNRFLKQILHSG